MQKKTATWMKTGILAGVLASVALSGAALASTFVLINGQQVPAHVEQKTIHIPGGVIHIETVSYGSGPQANVAYRPLDATQAQALMQQNLAQMQAMQVAMDRQMAMMQQMMQTAFAMPGMPMAQSPLQVFFPVISLPSLPAAVPQRSAQPAGVAPWQQGMYQVHWQQPEHPAAAPANPKIPL
jgi:hypothetical protein